MAEKPKNRWKKPLRLSSIDSIPEDAIGVYGFWCVNPPRCIYVGKAEKQSIRARLKQEWRNSHNSGLRAWIQAFGRHLEICYLAVPRANMHKVDGLETKLIRLWNPETNIQKKGDKQ